MCWCISNILISPVCSKLKNLVYTSATVYKMNVLEIVTVSYNMDVSIKSGKHFINYCTCYVFECSTVLYRLYLLTIKSIQPCSLNPLYAPYPPLPPTPWLAKFTWKSAGIEKYGGYGHIVKKSVFFTLWYGLFLPFGDHQSKYGRISVILCLSPQDLPWTLQSYKFLMWILRSQFDTKAACVLNV